MRGRIALVLGTLLAYAAPAALVWFVIGIVAWLLPQTWLLLVLLTGYSGFFGFAEISASAVMPPASSWQVPGGWVAHRHPARQTLVWGATLGPGLMTRNPYAGMWAVPALAVFSPNPVLTAMACGVVHASGRAIGILLNATRLGSSVDRIMLRYYWWRAVDGLALLVLAGLSILWLTR